MKIKVHENTGRVYITSEHPKELYLIGRLSAKIKGASTWKQDGDNRELEVGIDELINKLAE